MQAGQLTIATAHSGQINSSFSEKIGDWVARVFGCWHSELSRPFSHQGQAYRVCMNCGAQRRFNLGDWKMQGHFYYQKATTSQFYSMTGLSAIRRRMS